jgi:DNA-directed RNA polymerase subunit M/transcription elongation factor TFIIS
MEDYRYDTINELNNKNHLLNINIDSNLLEEEIYKFCNHYIKCNNLDIIYFKSIYKTKTNEILKSLNIDNDYLINEIKLNNISIIDLPYIKPQILYKKKWDNIVKRLEYIEFKKNNMATIDIYQCKKCKQNKCFIHQSQTRSADEPMTTFITCTVCGNHWKF